MLGYMNEEALRRTRSSGRVTFFSRRRDRLWTKGDSSGNWLELVEIQADCDRDALLVRAIPHGPTCHTGGVSCFGDSERPALGEVLADLSQVIESRKRERPPGSYTASLFEDGAARIARKVGEEALELGLGRRGPAQPPLRERKEMVDASRKEKPIWAKWSLEEGGEVEVIATYREEGGFVQVGSSYPSIADAEKALGTSFSDVVRAVMAAGGRSGRWRP
jgi:hypothetical protein